MYLPSWGIQGGIKITVEFVEKELVTWLVIVIVIVSSRVDRC